MAYSFEQLIESNISIIDAYSGMSDNDEDKPEGVLSTTKHKNVTTYNIHRNNMESAHNHLISKGYKQDGPSSVYGPATETRYIHPDTRKVAYLGSNRKTAWLDIHK